MASRKRKQKTLRPGDVFSVPRVPYGYHYIVYITSNQWGDAFGFLDGFTDVETMPSNPRPGPPQNTTYSDDEKIVEGRWKLIGNSTSILRLFPPEPEIYHEQDPADPETGPYGCAEHISGSIRQVSREEAESVRLGTFYLQIMSPEQIESYLNVGNPFMAVRR